jgi:trigger factor
VIINQQSLTPDPEKIRTAVEDIAGSYEDPDSVREWFFSKPENLRDVEGSVLEDSVVAWILSQVSVTDVSKPFSDIMNDAEQAGA